MLTLITMLLASPAQACLWDSDTLATEQIGMPGVLEVLTGRFDRFPDAYYADRLTRSRQALAKNPDNLAAYDDAAVSLDRLRRPTEAIALMEEKAAALARVGEDPAHRYRLLANQGTFYAHRWLAGSDQPADLAQAIALIEAAITLNPEAHFGREAVQLRALYWLRDAPTLTSALDLFSQPGLLGFEDWTSQTIAAVSQGEVDPELAGTIEGLTGLIVLGAAWESPDIHLALARALYASGQSTLGWMARLRVVELLEAGQTFRQPSEVSTRAIEGILLESSLQITSHAAEVFSEFEAHRAAAEVWRLDRADWIAAGLSDGRHPDTDPYFWVGAP